MQCKGLKTTAQRKEMEKLVATGLYYTKDLRALYRKFGLAPFVELAFLDAEFASFTRNQNLSVVFVSDFLHQVRHLHNSYTCQPLLDLIVFPHLTGCCALSYGRCWRALSRTPSASYQLSWKLPTKLVVRPVLRSAERS